MKLNALFSLVLLLLISCSKDGVDLPEGTPGDSTLQISDNPWFPMDTNDLWVYDDTYYWMEPCFDGETMEYCQVKETYRDTFLFRGEKLLGNYKVMAWNNIHNNKINRYYHTGPDRVNQLFDSSLYVDSIQAITILFTHIEDTNWIQTIKIGNTLHSIKFFQKHPVNAIEGLLELRVTDGEDLGFLSDYRFIRGKGLVSYSGTGGNSSLQGSLREFIDQ